MLQQRQFLRLLKVSLNGRREEEEEEEEKKMKKKMMMKKKKEKESSGSSNVRFHFKIQTLT